MPRMTERTTLYVNEMRWEPLEVPGSQGWAWIKTLSKDEETGARTALIRFDPGFKQERTVSNLPVDMLVLEGGAQCGDLTFRKGTYQYRPAGSEFGPISSPKGMVRLVFTADSRDAGSKKPVFVQDVDDMPWAPSATDMPGQERRIKVLRQDPETNYTLFLHKMRVSGSGPREGMTHIHEHSEEVFVLEGELEQYSGDIDGHMIWKPWTYVCRAPFAGQHGGPTTKTPCTVLVRLGWAGRMQDRYQEGQGHSPEMSKVSGAFFIE